MSTRDRVLGAVSYWFGIVGLIGLLLRDPPLHPHARLHCAIGLAMNIGLLAVQWGLAPVMARMSEEATVVLGCLAWPLLLYAIVGTVLAAIGRPPLLPVRLTA